MDGSLETYLARFLFNYCLTPQSVTGVSPAELWFGRPLQSQLNQLHSSIQSKVSTHQWQQKKNHGCHTQELLLQKGDLVFALTSFPVQCGFLERLFGSVVWFSIQWAGHWGGMWVISNVNNYGFCVGKHLPPYSPSFLLQQAWHECKVSSLHYNSVHRPLGKRVCGMRKIRINDLIAIPILRGKL